MAKKKTKPAARRRPPARKKSAPKPAPIDEAVLERVILLLVSIQDRSAVARACAEKLEIPEAHVPAVIAEARRQITLAADYHRTEELGKAIRRLEDCYARSLKVQDVKTALASQKEINKLLDLYRPIAPTADPHEDHSDAAEELEAVREYLEPLGLTGDDVSAAELCRLAVAELTRHQAEAQA